MISRRNRQTSSEIACSLDANGLAIGTHIAVANCGFSEPPLDLPGSDAGIHFELPRECIELSLASDATVSTPLTWPRIEVVGCLFDKPTEPEVAHKRRDSSASTSPPSSPSIRQTRIRPPRDLVKLEDRLRVLLQPPLEALLAARELKFPFQPFGFQLDGIAFLYPRHHAVLADEMGLGKTMQAVTAIRLLVHHVGMRRILLVCPKPLVTNWQREFAQWAPEIPITTIEGDQNR